MNRVKKAMPTYGVIMLLAVISFNMLVYNGNRIFTQNLTHHCISGSLDELIPFCPFFILFYVLAFVQWFIGFVMIARESRSFCFRYLTGEMIAKFIALLCFVIYPTTFNRAPFEALAANSSGIFERLTHLIYSLDPPDNLFPSIHCLESYICFRTAILLKGIRHKKIYVSGQFFMTVLVFASTVLVKQHVVADIFGGILAAEIGIAISGMFFKWREKKKLSK